MLIRNFALLTWVIFSFSLTLAPLAHADNLASQLPDIGEAGSTVLTPREEKQLGREFMHSIRQSLDLLDDPLSTAYLQNLADRLQIKTSDNRSQDITVFIVNDSSINAFAGPGGYIGIHTGLILAARTEGELASVLAHEIAHVTQRHLVRAFKASSNMSLSTMGAIIAAIVLGGSNPEIGEAVLASTVASNAQQQLTFSRNHEQEADRVGLDLLANADFDPRMMVSFFEILQQQQRTLTATTTASLEFLRTHPLTLARIADTRNRASQYPNYPLADNTSFQLIQARTATLASKASSNPFNSTARSSAINKAARQYYQALSASKLGNYSQARKSIRPLLRKVPRRVLYHHTAAEIELADNRPRQARKIIVKALELFPGNPSLVELYSDTLLQLQQPQLALDVLKTAIRQHPEQYHLYQTYAKVASRLEKKAEAYRALAEYQNALGNARQAIDHLKQALSMGTLDRYDQLSVKARLKELKTEVSSREQEKAHKDE